MSPSDSDGKGTFRGVPFLISREQRERGGRNIVKREYPLREQGGADDLGPKHPEYTFTVMVPAGDGNPRQALRDALRAPGPGELMHPDYGTLNVLINSFESRYNAGESGFTEFTLNVMPVSDDTAPAAKKDTAATLKKTSASSLGGVFNTLNDGWKVASDNLRDVQAMADVISEKVSALENAVSSIGIIADISAFASSFSALQGNITGLTSAPSRLTQGLAGVISGLTGLPTVPGLSLLGGGSRKDSSGTGNSTGSGKTRAPTPSGSLDVPDRGAEAQIATRTYHSLTRLQDRLRAQDRTRDLSTLSPVAQADIRLLQPVLDSAVTLARVRVAAQLLDLSVAAEAAAAPGSETAALFGAEPLTVPLLESATDVQRMARTLAQALDEQALAFSAQGYTATALQLRETRLALLADFTARGVSLPGARSVAVRTTEPALVTLWRATGDSRQWRRFARRNSLSDPLFVPGGRQVEVIDE